MRVRGWARLELGYIPQGCKIFRFSSSKRLDGLNEGEGLGQGRVRVSYRDANIYFLGKHLDSLNSISINNLRGGPSFASLLIFSLKIFLGTPKTLY